MKRLSKNNINTPGESERIFKERWKEELHYIDWERFVQLARFYEGGKYLDVGCFNSPMPAELARDFPDTEIWAIDHADYVIKTLAERHPEVKYMSVDITKKFPFQDEYFDYVVAGEVIEHMEKPVELIGELARITKPGGWIAISTPKEEGMGGQNVSKEHLWGFNADDIKDMLSPYGETKLGEYKDTITTLIGFVKKQ